MKKPENKVAVVYGDGTLGGAIAKGFFDRSCSNKA